MLKKTENTLFFPAISPLDVVRKTLEGLIAYNKIYRKRVETANTQELAEIVLSTYFNSENLPPTKKDLSVFFKQEGLNNTNFILGVDVDIKGYGEMLEQVDKGNYDLIYLKIYFFRQVWSQSMKFQATKKTELMLAMLLESPLVKKHSKRISQLILKDSEEIPLTGEINALTKLLKILKPEISPACVRYAGGITVEWLGGKTLITLDKEEQWRLNQLRKNLVELVVQQNNQELNEFKRLLSAISTSGGGDILKAERDKLGDFSIDLDDEILLAQLYLDYLIAKNATQDLGSGDIFDQTLNHYQAVTSMFQIEHRVALFSQKVEMRKLELLKVEKQKLKEQKLAPRKPLEEQHKPVENVVVEKIDEVMPQLTDIQGEAPASPVIISAEIPQIEDEKTEVTSEKIERTVGESAEPVTKVVNELNSPKAPVQFFKPYFKNQEQKALTQTASPRNLLKLEGEHLDTYLKVFDLKPCTSIGLRPLMNLLTIHFGGKMGKSKANRCCFKINNIFAFISVPREPLEKPCTSATISMHGGGHRSTRSQNNDRGTAPHYLVEQCRDALTRAGFTPVNLGLEVQINVAEAIKSGF